MNLQEHHLKIINHFSDLSLNNHDMNEGLMKNAKVHLMDFINEVRSEFDKKNDMLRQAATELTQLRQLCERMEIRLRMHDDMMLLLRSNVGYPSGFEATYPIEHQIKRMLDDEKNTGIQKGEIKN